MSSRFINIEVSVQLLQKIDAAAKANYMSRSAYIRQSVAMRINQGKF